MEGENGDGVDGDEGGVMMRESGDGEVGEDVQWGGVQGDGVQGDGVGGRVVSGSRGRGRRKVDERRGEERKRREVEAEISL